ncbi:MAG TPA: hypothetical protein K8V82_04585 [Lachnoclostridium phocaeense]|uniref:Uncharacterized protein n=1 Tax=Lachnoclostridium phocaeense TaxID=1871021 RepID=A0A921I028_9FIRM|nr:hypothetical protein [Lachnoclostridium phocaeense]
MLEVVLDRQIMVILMGIAAAVGVISKIIAAVSLKRLVRASGNMNKSSHPLIRLVKAKFEHACMVSDRVQNVEVFVEKYLYEYRAGGLRLHTWRRLEKAGVWLCFLFGLAGAVSWYAARGMGDQVLQYAAAGAGGGILIFLFQLTSDEKYQLGAIRNYMVDYLENVCAHRYEKAQADRVKDEWRAMAPPDTNAQYASDREQRPEIRRPAEPQPEVIQPAREIQPEILDPAGGPELGTPENRPDQSRQSEEGLENAEVRAVQAGVEEIAQAEALEARKRQSGKDRLQKEAKAARAKAGKGEDEVSKEVRIREILEEFLA